MCKLIIMSLESFCKMVMTSVFALVFSAFTDCNVQGSKLCCLPFNLGELICGFWMEKKRLDDYEPGPIPSPRSLDRFGFVKQDVITNDGILKSRSANESARYFGFSHKPLIYVLLFF